VQKLSGYAPLDDVDASHLAAACSSTIDVRADVDLIREGDEPGPVFVMLEGWACRYKMLPEGGRQITAILMPGDFCDMHVAILDRMDHSIATLTPAKVARIGPRRLEALMEDHPTIARAFWWTQLVDEAVLRAWIVSIGRRDAYHRVAHLLTELWARAFSIGRINADTTEMPLTQTEIADACGITAVHANRILKQLHEEGLIAIKKRLLTVANPAALAAAAGFDDNYLHRTLTRGRRPDGRGAVLR
jgi:CRP-like cAMP-binding protein